MELLSYEEAIMYWDGKSCPKCSRKALVGENEFGDKIGVWCSICGTEPFETEERK